MPGKSLLAHTLKPMTRSNRSHWHLAWAIGLLLTPIVFYSTRSSYFACNLAFPFFAAPSGCATIYQSMVSAQLVYFGSLVAAYAALYALVSLNARKISRREAAVHLIAWTLVPPLWFSFERYFFFDPPAAQVAAMQGTSDASREARLKALREGQDYASKLWSGVLAVLIAFKLGEIVNEKKADSAAGEIAVAVIPPKLNDEGVDPSHDQPGSLRAT